MVRKKKIVWITEFDVYIDIVLSSYTFSKKDSLVFVFFFKYRGEKIVKRSDAQKEQQQPPNLGQKTRPYNNQQQKKEKKKEKKKKTCKIVNFAVPADHRIKLKECEKRDKYLDLSRELKKLWNMKVTIIPIVIGVFVTVTKGLPKGLKDLEVGGRVETIQTTALLRTVGILRRVLQDLRRLAVTQTPAKDHRLILMWKTLMIK